MNHLFNLNRRFILLSLISLVSKGMLSDQAFAGKEEELAARKNQIEQQVFQNIKASIVGGSQTPENRLVIDTLRMQKEMKSIARLPGDTIIHGFKYLNGPSFIQASCANHSFAAYARNPSLKKEIKTNNARARIMVFDNSAFVRLKANEQYE